jgi:hypothetical protein
MWKLKTVDSVVDAWAKRDLLIPRQEQEMAHAQVMTWYQVTPQTLIRFPRPFFDSPKIMRIA